MESTFIFSFFFFFTCTSNVESFRLGARILNYASAPLFHFFPVVFQYIGIVALLFVLAFESRHFDQIFLCALAVN